MLTQKEAITRFEQIDNNVKYWFTLNLSAKNYYKGYAKVEFTCNNNKNLFLDFRGKKVLSLTINQYSFQISDLEKLVLNGRIYLPLQNLVINHQNTVEVFYKSKYNLDQIGLCKYQDLDGNMYLYTQSVPYDLNLVFPLFDQPDIKGTMRLNLIVPRKWEVSSNELVDKIYDYKNIEESIWHELVQQYFDDLGTKKFYSFNETSLLSTYLFAFIAGDYVRIKTNNYYNSDVFCQMDYSIYAKNDIQEIGKVIEESINYFQDFFGIKYPFSKCDLAFVPHSKYQAMENPGIITYNDQFGLFSKQQSVQDIENRRMTISHEISHQWFGNLVTMKWWDNIWLNESFAEFCSHLCANYLQEKVPYKNSKQFDHWLKFSEKKQWGFQEDFSTRTTHPIVQQVNNTCEANTIFDGISYSKGAASLQQFYYLIGEQNFRLGLQRYFKKFQWSNTTLQDFIDIFQEVMQEQQINLDLIKWKAQWLETAGLNIINAQLQNNQLIINQSTYDQHHQQLRQHLIQFSFFDYQFNLNFQENILILDKEKQIQNISQDNSFYILPNSNDQSYILIELYGQEKIFLQNLNKLNQIQQYQIIFCFYSQIISGKLKADEFLSMIVEYKIIQNLQDSIQVFCAFIKILEDILIFTLHKSDKKDRIFSYLCKIFQDQISNIPKTILTSILIKLATNTQNLRNLKDLYFNYNNNKIINIYDLWNICWCYQIDPQISNKTKNSILQETEDKGHIQIQQLFDRSIICLTMNEDEILQYWEEILLKKNMFQIHLFKYFGMGFNKGFQLNNKFDYYIELFFERYVQIMGTQSYLVCKKYFQQFFPKTQNHQQLNKIIQKMSQLEAALDKQNLNYFLKEKQKVQILYYNMYNQKNMQLIQY